MQRQRLRHRFERIGLGIGIVLAIFIVAAVVNWVIERSDQGPLEPSPEVTVESTIGPTLAAGTATPISVFDPAPPPAPGSLLDMLGYAPDRLADDSLPLSDIAQYADIERWMAARGVAMPVDANDPGWNAWKSELSSLAIPEVLATRGLEPGWVQTYGFGLHQVDQLLAVGSAPDFVLVMRGDFDPAVLTSVWAENGYQAVRVNDVTYWSLYPGGSVDLSAPASRPALGNMNNVAILDDGTLIATARSGRLEQTIRTVQGAEPSLVANPALQAIIAPGTDPQRFVTAVLLKGQVLEPVAISAPPSATGTPIPQVSPADFLIAGLYLPEGDPDSPRLMLVTSYDSTDAATSAFVRADRELGIGTSTVTEQAYGDRVIRVGMRVLAATAGGGLLIVQLDLVDGIADWLEIIEQRDLGYLMWP